MGLALKWSRHVLNLDQRTHVMGVLNVTPDSFSDGGKYFQREKAIARGLEMAREGADVIDVGGESTRPYSGRISSAEEMERVIPAIEALSKELSVPISIDTYKSDVAREALRSGASMINDVSALRFDPSMASLAGREGVPVVLMHMKGTPEQMQDNPTYDDLISEIRDFLREAIERAVAGGIRDDLIVVDPGIGFGKTYDDNLKILKEIEKLKGLGKPVMLGTSNKAFIGKILNKEPHERDTGTMATVAYAAMAGVHMVRVHNVKESVETVKVIEAIKRARVRET